MKTNFRYRKLKGYKYQLLEDYSLEVDIYPRDPIATHFLLLMPSGLLRIRKGYAWDGASSAFDSADFMRGSLVHDALYQLIREGYLAKTHRKYADILLRDICTEDGMNRVRAWYVYHAVRLFAGFAIKN